MINSKEHINKYPLEEKYLEKDFELKLKRIAEDPFRTDLDFSHGAETKIVTGGTLPFSAFQPQQLPSLVAIDSEVGFYYKPTDASMGLKPLDHYFHKKEVAIVIVQFWKNKQQEIAYWMCIRDVMKIMYSGRKSMEEADFQEFGKQFNVAKYNKKIYEKDCNKKLRRDEKRTRYSCRRG